MNPLVPYPGILVQNNLAAQFVHRTTKAYFETGYKIPIQIPKELRKPLKAKVENPATF